MPSFLHWGIEQALKKHVGESNYEPIETERFVVRPSPSTYSGQNNTEAYVLVVPAAGMPDPYVKVFSPVVVDLEVESGQQRLAVLETVNRVNLNLLVPHLSLRDSEANGTRIEISGGMWAKRDEAVDAAHLAGLINEVVGTSQVLCKQLISSLGMGKTLRQRGNLMLP